MKQSAMLAVLALALSTTMFCGCRSQSQMVDPFFGRTRVEPPGTGAVSNRNSDPYYRNNGRAMVPFNQLKTSQSKPKDDVSPITPVADRERIVRVIEPRDGTAVASDPGPVDETSIASSRAPRLLKSPERAIDITELPDSRRSPVADGFRLVSGEEPSASSEFRATAASSAAMAGNGNYAYDPDYEWVRGKLEYSQIDRRWKVRYIPVDGTTDRFGGSVVLSDTSALSGLERGDFVEVRGRIGRAAKKGAYAPVYDVAEIDRVRL